MPYLVEIEGFLWKYIIICVILYAYMDKLI